MKDIPKKGQRVRVVEVAANGPGIILPVGTELTLEHDAEYDTRSLLNIWVRLRLAAGIGERDSGREVVRTRQMLVEIVGGPSKEVPARATPSVRSLMKQHAKIVVTPDGRVAIDWSEADARVRDALREST